MFFCIHNVIDLTEDGEDIWTKPTASITMECKAVVARNEKSRMDKVSKESTPPYKLSTLSGGSNQVKQCNTVKMLKYSATMYSQTDKWGSQFHILLASLMRRQVVFAP